MKVLLQNTRTGCYFQAENTWTPKILAACDFTKPEEALTFAVRKGVPHVQMVLKFEGEDYDMSLWDAPVNDLSFGE